MKTAIVFVKYADGSTAAGARVDLLARRVGGDMGLGSATVDLDAARLDYTPATPYADIYARVTWPDGSVTTSNIVIGAKDEETIVVTSKSLRGETEFHQVEKRLGEICEKSSGQTVEYISNIDSRDIGYVAARSGIDPTRVRLYKRALQLSSVSSVEAKIFYALGRQQIPIASASSVGAVGAGC